MQHAQIARNPFALMTHPEAIFAAIESSERLGRLHSRICRPLVKPLLGQAGEESAIDDDAVDSATDSALEEGAADPVA